MHTGIDDKREVESDAVPPSPDLRALLDRTSASADSIRVLVALHQRPDRSATTAELAAAAGISELAALRSIAELVARDIRLEVQLGVVRLAAQTDDVDVALAELVTVYDTDRPALAAALADIAVLRMRALYAHDREALLLLAPVFELAYANLTSLIVFARIAQESLS
jgi:hypothetical protein